MSINWEHPDVHALILQKLQNDPGALTQAQIAERASIILQRKIQPTNIQRRLTSLKNKLQNQENVSTTARLAPYTKNPPKQQKTVSDMSNRSLLGKIDEAFTELKNRINIEDVGIADSVTKQASSNLDSFFASPVRPKDGFVWEFNGLEAEKRKAEYKEGENVKCREGLNSKLNTCILVDEDNYTYEFSYSHERDGVKYYKCKDCRSSGKTTYLRIYMNGEAKMANHCEDCNPRTCIDTEVLQADRRCRLDASEGKKAYDAYMNTYATLKDAKLDPHYQPYWYYRRQLGRWRQQNFPTSQLGSTDEKYRKLYGCNTGWLDYEDENVAVFCTDRSYRILANCRIIVGDATFSTSPKGVYQTFYIHGFVENDKGGEWIPLLMALMKKKEKKYYQVVVEKIKEAWQRLQVEPRIQRFHLDYEAAEDDAMKNLVGEDKVYGCLFHYNQIIIRRLGKKLYQAYCMKRGKTNIPYYRSIRSWIRCILALPLLPHDDAIYLWNTVLHQIPKRPQTVAEKLWPTAELEEMKEYMVSFDNGGTNLCKNKSYYCSGKCCVNVDISKITSKIWLTDELYFSKRNIPNFVSMIVPKLYGCEKLRLMISFITFTVKDFQLLASKYVKFYFFCVNFINEDGSAAMLDNILESIPNSNCKEFHYQFDVNIPAATGSTMKKISNLQNLGNLQVFRLYYVSEAFNVDDIGIFIKNHKNTKIELHFGVPLSNEYKNRLDALIDSVIASDVPNRIIHYPGQDRTKHEIMKSRYRL